jgi:alpha-tubulin suppressor-like RCC1 family protein
MRKWRGGRRFVVAVVVAWSMGSGVQESNIVLADSNEATTPRESGLAGKISVGSSHACMVSDISAVSCWGSNEHGQMGIGSNIANFPSPTGNAVDGVAVAAGGRHTCAIRRTGVVTCWGRGASGQLGYGNTNNIGDDEKPSQNPVNGGIVLMPQGLRAKAITAGDEHSCALLMNNEVACWGANNVGQLGYGNTNNIGDDEKPSQNPVNGGFVPLPGPAKAISAGAQHTCAILLTEGAVCWGGGASGRLGYGNTNNIGDDETPRDNPVNGGIVPTSVGSEVLSISAGFAHTCAIIKPHLASCWGFNGTGQLGYGNTNNIGDDETPRDNPVDGGIVLLPGLEARAVTAGLAHSCALLAGGLTTCWGWGANGQLGYGNVTTIGDNEKPSQNPAGSGIVFMPGGEFSNAISAGVETTCTILRSGSPVCWGNGSTGKLGYGNFDTIGDNERPIDNPVWSGLVPTTHADQILDISAAEGSRCALTGQGQVRCWGEGNYGELGNGSESTIGDDEYATSGPRAGVVGLPGNETAVQVDMGYDHGCAVLASGDVSCWGRGEQGQLGFGNTDDLGDLGLPSQQPTFGGRVPLPGGAKAVKVSAGVATSCAIVRSGDVTCWGSGIAGGLGYGNTNTIGDNETPAQNPVNGGFVALPGGLKAIDVSVGSRIACVVLTSGGVACWGQGPALGYGNTNHIGDDETPAQNPVNGGLVPLPGGQRATAVSVGSSHICALLLDRTVTCWGTNVSGSLGYGNLQSIGDNETPAQNPVNGGIVPLPLSVKVDQVSAGGNSTCVRTTLGVACWGLNSLGQLGYGNVNSIGNDETPAQNPVGGGFIPGTQEGVRRVSAGSDHSCVAYINSVRCFGAGPLGYGNTNAIGDDELIGSVQPIWLTRHLVPDDVVSLGASRMLDTRTSAPQAAGSTAVILDKTGTLSILYGAKAMSLTVTAVEPSASGYFTVFPCDEPKPLAASLNYQVGYATSNTVMAKVAADGSICVFTSARTHIVVDSHVSVPTSSSWIPLSPARLLDTRANGQTIDGQSQAGGATLGGFTFSLPVAGRGGLPASPSSVMLNIAAVGAVADGYLTVYPCGTPRPLASSLNYSATDAVSNHSIAAVTFGNICVFASSTTHVVVDVVGYLDTSFIPGPTRYHTIPPTRLGDTRATGVTVDGRSQATGRVAAGTEIRVPVAFRGPVQGVDVAVLNVAAVRPSANGFITVYPCGSPTRPNVASLVFKANITRSATVFTRIGYESDEACIYTSADTDLVVDVIGSTT